MSPATAFLLTFCALALAALGYSWGFCDGKRRERLRIIDALDGVHPPPMRITRAWLQDMLKPTAAEPVHPRKERHELE